MSCREELEKGTKVSDLLDDLGEETEVSGRGTRTRLRTDQGRLRCVLPGLAGPSLEMASRTPSNSGCGNGISSPARLPTKRASTSISRRLRNTTRRKSGGPWRTESLGQEPAGRPPSAKGTGGRGGDCVDSESAVDLGVMGKSPCS